MSRNNKDKNDGNFAIGIIIATIGVIALFATLGYIKIIWSVIWKLWPILLILIGIYMLPINKYVKSIILVIIILGSCFIYQDKVWNYNYGSTRVENFYEHDENNEDMIPFASKDDKDIDIQEFSEPYQKVVNTAKVNIEYNIGELKLNIPTSDLVRATNTSGVIRQDFKVTYDKDNANIEFESSDNIKIKKKSKIASSRFDIALNEYPVWDFEIDLGACDLNFDFTPYKVSKIELNGGACNIEMKISNLQKNTKIDLKTGVSNIKIGIPKEAACRIKSESVLSDKDFKGFVKKNNGIYETSNYMESDQIIEIYLSCTISDVTVYRY